MKRRIAKKQMRRAEGELVAVLKLYVTRPPGDVNEEVARGVIGVVRMLILAFRELGRRGDLFTKVQLATLEMDSGSRLVGTGTLVSWRNGAGGEVETTEDFRVIFELGKMTRRRVPYVIQVPNPAVAEPLMR